MTNNTFPFAVYTTKLAAAAPGIDVLNDLISVCSDSMLGFRTAAEAVEQHELKEVLGAHAEQREKFGAYLANFAVELGGEVDASGSVQGAVHRAWINVKSAVAPGNASAILAEALRGEEAALEAYAEANLTVLPEAVQTVIEEQHNAIAHSARRLEDLHRVYSD